jgi:hypothetical protein
MPVMDLRCLYSTVRNTSGGRKTFGFLPPHGRTLAANEEFTCYGDVRQAIIRFERSEARRNIIAFEHALQRGDIMIESTPTPIMEDAATHAVKMLSLTGGTLGMVDPCWTQSLVGSESLSNPIG